MSQTTKQTPKPSPTSAPTDPVWTPIARAATATSAPTPQSRAMRVTSLLGLAVLLVAAAAVAFGVHAVTSHRASPTTSISGPSADLVAHGSGNNIRTESGSTLGSSSTGVTGGSTDLMAHGSGNNIRTESGNTLGSSSTGVTGGSTDLMAHGSGNNIRTGSGSVARAGR